MNCFGKDLQRRLSGHVVNHFRNKRDGKNTENLFTLEPVGREASSCSVVLETLIQESFTCAVAVNPD